MYIYIYIYNIYIYIYIYSSRSQPAKSTRSAEATHSASGSSASLGCWTDGVLVLYHSIPYHSISRYPILCCDTIMGRCKSSDFDRLGKKVPPGTSGNIEKQVNGSTPKSPTVKKHKVCSDHISETHIYIYIYIYTH